MAAIETRSNLNGKTTYRVKIRLKGYPVQHASFSRLTDARRWAQTTESAIREGRHFKTNEAKRHTLADAIKRYAMEVMPNKTGSNSQHYQLYWWKTELGAYVLADITPALISQCREKLLRESVPASANKLTKNPTSKIRKPATVVRYLAVLSHLFSTAVKEWQWCEDNPVKKISKPKEPRGRVRFLSDEDRDALLDACKLSHSKTLYLVVVLAISTGMRQGELMSLRWNQIDFKGRGVTLHETKNGERRRVTLVGLALKLMQDHGLVRRTDTDLVFPGKNPLRPVDLKKPWATALAATGIQNFRFHDLRHSAASYLAMNGATLAEIADVLGHKTLSMVKRYTHIGEAHSAKVVAAMNDKIFAGA
jgi:integrase